MWIAKTINWLHGLKEILIIILVLMLRLQAIEFNEIVLQRCSGNLIIKFVLTISTESKLNFIFTRSCFMFNRQRHGTWILRWNQQVANVYVSEYCSFLWFSNVSTEFELLSSRVWSLFIYHIWFSTMANTEGLSA